MTDHYDKPFLKIEKQINQLRDRGMVIGDKELARQWLLKVSYYRLSPYWKIFEVVPDKEGEHAFMKGSVSFEDVVSLYEFDCRLRQLVWSAMERIEVAIRGSWAYHSAMNLGPQGYQLPEHYKLRDQFEKNRKTLANNYQHSRSEIAGFFRSKYRKLEELPVWMAAELNSFGELAHWIVNLDNDKLIKRMLDPLGLNLNNFESVLDRLQEIRNVCAHHDRLWNRRFKTILHNEDLKHLERCIMKSDPDRLHNLLVLLDYLLKKTPGELEWRSRIISLIDECGQAEEWRMGFPDDWRSERFWESVGE